MDSLRDLGEFFAHIAAQAVGSRVRRFEAAERRKETNPLA